MSSSLILALRLGLTSIEDNSDISRPNSISGNGIVVISGFAHGSEVNLNHAELNLLELRIQRQCINYPNKFD